jgi:hypothetical protein
MSRDAYLAGLIMGVPQAAPRKLLNPLSRNIHTLPRLLAQSNVQIAVACRDMLDTLDGDVRRHLAQAAALMANLRPRGSSTETTHRPSW